MPPRAKGKGAGRRPALGGALRPTREDAQASQEVVYEYSQKLNQQVVALEAENIELKDGKDKLEVETKGLREQVVQLQKVNAELQDAGFATFQERNITVHHAQDVLRQKQGEVMLLRHTADQHWQRGETLAADKARLAGIAERLQGERTELQRQVLGLEATANAMQAEIAEQANSEAHAAMQSRKLDQQVNSLTMQKMRLDQEMGKRHVEVAHLRHTREELVTEKQDAHRLREELADAAASKARLQHEVDKLCQTVSALHLEVGGYQRAKEAADAEIARLWECINREESMNHGLHARITELEDMIGSLRRGNMALEGDNGALRSALTRARSEVEGCLQASTQIVHEKSGVEQIADEESTRRMELERLLQSATSENLRLRKQNDTLQFDNQKLHARAVDFEGENVVLQGQLKGSEVVLRGLRSDCAKLDFRNQQSLHKELESIMPRVRTPSPPRSMDMRVRVPSPRPDEAPPPSQYTAPPAALAVITGPQGPMVPTPLRPSSSFGGLRQPGVMPVHDMASMSFNNLVPGRHGHGPTSIPAVIPGSPAPAPSFPQACFTALHR